MTPGTLWSSIPSQPFLSIADQSYFEWIQSTDDPRFVAIREEIDILFFSAPPTCRAEYESRLKSKTRSDFLSAYCELWYARELIKHGILVNFPEARKGLSLPDLVLLVNGKEAAVAECHLRMGSNENEKQDRRLDTLLRDTFNKLLHKDIRLKVHMCVQTSLTPSPKDFAAFLEDVYSKQPPDSDSEPTPHSDLHRCIYDCQRSGWSLDVTVCKRNTPDLNPRLMLMISGEMVHLQGPNDLEDALKRKAGQHPSWHLPKVICLGWNDFSQKPSSEEIREVITHIRTSLHSQDVIGVFFTGGIYPWAPTGSRVTLYHWNDVRLNDILCVWNGDKCDVSIQRAST
jgi:hypothetical protein